MFFIARKNNIGMTWRQGNGGKCVYFSVSTRNGFLMRCFDHTLIVIVIKGVGADIIFDGISIKDDIFPALLQQQ